MITKSNDIKQSFEQAGVNPGISKPAEENPDTVPSDDGITTKDPQDMVEESEYPGLWRMASILVALVFTSFLVWLPFVEWLLFTEPSLLTVELTGKTRLGKFSQQVSHHSSIATNTDCN